MEIISNKNLPLVAKKEPAMVKVEAGKTYAWCTCGLSDKQPFCNGTHKNIEPVLDENAVPKSPFASLKVSFEEEKEVCFCQCKQTKNPPYCDGSHKNITT